MLEAKEAEIGDSKQPMEKSQDEVARLRADNDVLRQQLLDLNDVVADLRGERAELELELQKAEQVLGPRFQEGAEAWEELSQQITGVTQTLQEQVKKLWCDMRARIAEKQSAVEDLERALRSGEEIQAMLKKEREQKEKEVLELDVQLRQVKGEATSSSTRLEEIGSFLLGLNKELRGVCTDPISLQQMRDPVLAADLHTYDRQSIEDWHKVSPTSPHTRGPMEITTLRSNRIAVWVAEANCRVASMCQKFWPGKATSDSEPVREVLPVLVKRELPAAIRCGREDEALELLARDIDDMYLNGAYSFLGQQWTLLQFALLRHLPAAALAIAARKDFRRGHCPNESGVQAIHLATALGFTNVCRTLVDDYGSIILGIGTQRQMSVDLPTGGTITVRKGVNSLDLARNLKHDSLLAMFRTYTDEPVA